MIAAAVWLGVTMFGAVCADLSRGQGMARAVAPSVLFVMGIVVVVPRALRHKASALYLVS